MSQHKGKKTVCEKQARTRMGPWLGLIEMPKDRDTNGAKHENQIWLLELDLREKEASA